MAKGKVPIICDAVKLLKFSLGAILHYITLHYINLHYIHYIHFADTYPEQHGGDDQLVSATKKVPCRQDDADFRLLMVWRQLVLPCDFSSVGQHKM